MTSLLHTYCEAGRACHRCRKQLTWHLKTAAYMARELRVDGYVDGQNSTPREHYGELLLCYRCFASVGKVLAELVEALDTPYVDTPARDDP